MIATVSCPLKTGLQNILFTFKILSTQRGERRRRRWALGISCFEVSPEPKVVSEEGHGVLPIPGGVGVCLVSGGDVRPRLVLGHAVRPTRPEGEAAVQMDSAARLALLVVAGFGEGSGVQTL